MRTVGRRTKPFSAQELLNQAKMKAVSEFLRPIKPYVKFGFQQAAPPGAAWAHSSWRSPTPERTRLNSMQRTNRLSIPKGCLYRPGHSCRHSAAPYYGKGIGLFFQWDFLGQGASDRLVALLYDGMQFSFFREVGAERSTLTDSWEVDRLHVLKTPVHVYVAFRDTILNRISDSVYCGAV